MSFLGTSQNYNKLRKGIPSPSERNLEGASVWTVNPVFLGAVRRFLELRGESVELVVFAVENADEVSDSKVLEVSDHWRISGPEIHMFLKIPAGN